MAVPVTGVLAKKSGPWGPGYEGYQGEEQDVLGHINQGLNGPTDAVRSMIRGGDEAVARKARQMEGAAGARAAGAGALGQGTAANLADDTQEGILSEISKNAQTNTSLVGNQQEKYLQDAQSMVQQGRQGSQFDRQITETGRQFDASQDSHKADLDQNQRQFVQSQISELAKGNPVLAGKFSQYMMTGGKGDIGDFTPAEQKQLSEWVSSNKEMDDLTKRALTAQLQGIAGGGEATARSQAITSKPIEATDFSKGDGKAYADALPEFSPFPGPTPKAEVEDWAKKNAGKDVRWNGHVYRVLGPGRAGDDRYGVVMAKDERGNTVYLGQ